MAKQLDFGARREQLQPLLHIVPQPSSRDVWVVLPASITPPSWTACSPPAPSHRMSRTMPLSPMRPNLEHSGSWAFKDAAATGIQSDPHVVTARSLSSHRPQESPPPRNSRAFFDVVLAAPVTEITHVAAVDNAGADTAFQHPPSKPMTLVAPSRPAPKKKSRKRKQATPEESESDDDSESEYAPEDESSDEDEPTPLRGLVKLMVKGRSCAEPPILTSDIRGTIPDTSCEETRRLFDVEYSTHKKPAIKRSTRSSPRAPKPKAEGVRKSNRLATRSGTPFDADSSATDISVIGSSRSMSVVSVRNPPVRKPKAKSAKSKPAPRPSPSSNSGRDQSTPQPMDTSMAYPPDDPPPPAPTHVVSLRPGYNAYTAQDKQWFLDFVAWVFRQNVHAGKAEICQDIFQQAPHHRLESWKSYWRDHISQVEVLRNQARDRLEKQTPPLGKGSAYRSRDKRSSTPYTRPSPLTIATPDSTGAPRRTHKSTEANKCSDGLWALAELAELERQDKSLFNVGTTRQRKIDEDEPHLPRSKRPRY